MDMKPNFVTGANEYKEGSRITCSLYLNQKNTAFSLTNEMLENFANKSYLKVCINDSLKNFTNNKRTSFYITFRDCRDVICPYVITRKG